MSGTWWKRTLVLRTVLGAAAVGTLLAISSLLGPLWDAPRAAPTSVIRTVLPAM
jgi:hypothetical protein